MAARRSLAELQFVIDLVKYPGFEFKLSQDGEGDSATAWVQIVCPDGKDTVTGEPMPWKARKWKVSFYSTDTEIVQTLWVAVQRALLHEACELFKFSGVAIFDRHINVYKLRELAMEADALEHRDLAKPEDPKSEAQALAAAVFGAPTTTTSTVAIPPTASTAPAVKEFEFKGPPLAKKAPKETPPPRKAPEGTWCQRVRGGDAGVVKMDALYEVERLDRDPLLGYPITVYLKVNPGIGYMPENFEFNPEKFTQPVEESA